jgi:hypothetical protein
MCDKIYLFFPYKTVSGVPILFSRIVEHFSKYKKVTIIDYEDGALNKLSSNYPVEKIIFQDGQKINIPNGILILQSYSPEYIRPELTISKNVKILFWILHSKNLQLNSIYNNFQFKYLRFFELNKLRAFVRLIDKKSGLISMDESTKIDTENYLNINLQSKIVPILVKIPFIKNKKIINDRNSWAYIGRVESFKTKPLMKLLESLEILNNQGVLDDNFIFYIIGDGKDLKLINSFSKKLSLNINFLGFIENEKLPKLITKLKISCVAAMGTAILDAMSYGCAVVKLDFFYYKNKNYPKYYFKVDHNTFCLGRELNNIDFSNKFPSDLKDIYLNYSNNFTDIIKKQDNYLMTFYNDSTNIKRLQISIDNCDLKYFDINQYFKRSIIRKIYHYYRYSLFK